MDLTEVDENGLVNLRRAYAEADNIENCLLQVSFDFPPFVGIIVGKSEVLQILIHNHIHFDGGIQNCHHFPFNTNKSVMTYLPQLPAKVYCWLLQFGSL